LLATLATNESRPILLGRGAARIIRRSRLRVPGVLALLMLLDFEVQRSTRRCAATDRPLEPGDTCYSVLEVRGADVIRKDYWSGAWNGPPVDAFAWWRSQVPEATAKKIKLAPNDVLLDLFEQLGDEPDNADMRYVLALLLLRRRVLRLDVPMEGSCVLTGQGHHPEAAEVMGLYCPKRDASFVVPVAMPIEERIDEIQQRLSELLIAGAE
jgi:hypothetical protein